MSLTSMQFILFYVVTLFLYYVVPRKIQWIILLLASYFFYLYASMWLVIYLFAATLSTWFGTMKMEGKEKPEKKRLATWIGLFNFGMLAVLKYNGLFISDSLIIVPLGISFYIFQSMGYVYDVYRNRIKAETNFLKYALFVAFFPQIIQGPISRFKELGTQLYAEHNFSHDRLREGLKLILWGYIKKMVIADRAAVIVNEIYGNYLNYSGAMIMFGVLLYCIQIYCDFSGGIDIIRGVSATFDISLAKNFIRPYFATSLSDYWRRWHITLGTWMKDYLFYPMSLSKSFLKFNKKTRKKIPGMIGKILPTSLITFVVFFVIGLWHGADMKYIIFGIYNGVIITSSLILAPYYKRVVAKLGINTKNKLWTGFQIIRTTGLVFLGRYLTRGVSYMAAGVMMKRSVLNFGSLGTFINHVKSMQLTLVDYALIFVGVAVIFIFGYIEEKGVDVQKIFEDQHILIQSSVIFVAMMVLMIFGIYREGYIASEFIYKQF